MNKAFVFCLLIVGLINFAPIAGTLGVKKLEKAYDVSIDNPDLSILMRHRALLFGLLGGFILVSILVPAYQVPAMIMAAISMVGFAVICHTEVGYNMAIGKVLIADYVGILFLALAGLFKVFGANDR